MEIFNVVQRRVFRDLKETNLNAPTNSEAEFYCNVGERICVEDTIDHGWYFKAQPRTSNDEGGQLMFIQAYGSLYDIQPPFYAYSARIIRVEGVDWLSEGARVGDSCWAYWDGVPFGEAYFTIQAIKGDSLVVKWDFGDTGEHYNFKICSITNFYCADFSQSWQKLDNETAVNLLTNETPKYRAIDFNDTDEIEAIYNNENKAGKNTSILIKRLQGNITYPIAGFPGGVRRYRVRYFTYTPFWIENDQLDAIFKGDGTLRFNTQIDFRRYNYLDVNTVRTLNNVTNSSALGYFKESGKNGSKFLDSCRILDTTPSFEFDVLNKLKVLFRIKTTKDINYPIEQGDVFSVTIFNKKDALDYRFNETSLEYANWFTYKKVFLYQNATFTDSGFITNIQSTTSNEDGKLCIDVQLEVDYEKEDLPSRWAEGDEVRVIFAMQGEDGVFNSIYCDVPLIKNTDETGLIVGGEFRVYDQFSNLLTDNQNSLKANIQDTIYVKTSITCTPKYNGNQGKYSLNSITGKLIAYRQLGAKIDWFELTSINIDKGLLTRVGSNDTFNNTYLSDYSIEKNNLDSISVITNLPASFFGYTKHDVAFPLKITWQDWNEIQAHEVFYNENLDYNGFNQNAMTYFNKFGFEIRAVLDVDVLNNTTGITTTYRINSGALDLLDKNEGYGVTPIEIKTFDSNGNDLNQKLLDGEICAIKTYFDNTDLQNCDICFAYEVPEQAGFALIENSTGGYLQGLWQTQPIIESITPTEIIVSATILGDGNAYNLSCKIQEKPPLAGDYSSDYTTEYD